MNGACAHNAGVYANLERETEAVGVKVQCENLELVSDFFFLLLKSLTVQGIDKNVDSQYNKSNLVFLPFELKTRMKEMNKLLTYKQVQNSS